MIFTAKIFCFFTILFYFIENLWTRKILTSCYLLHLLLMKFFFRQSKFLRLKIFLCSQKSLALIVVASLPVARQAEASCETKWNNGGESRNHEKQVVRRKICSKINKIKNCLALVFKRNFEIIMIRIYFSFASKIIE